MIGDICKINGLLPLYLQLCPSLFYKRTWHPDPDKMFILRHYSAIFLVNQLSKHSKIPCLSTSSLGFIGLLCDEQSNFGLSNNYTYLNHPVLESHFKSRLNCTLIHLLPLQTPKMWRHWLGDWAGNNENICIVTEKHMTLIQIICIC